MIAKVLKELKTGGRFEVKEKLMQTTFLLLTLLFFATAVVLAVVSLIRKIIHRPAKKVFFVSLGLLGASILSLLISSGSEINIGDCVLILAVLLAPACLICLVAALICRLIKKGKPKKLLFIALGCFLGSIGLFVAFYYVQQAGQNRMREAGEIETVEVTTDCDFEVVDGDMPLTVALDNDWNETSWNRQVYDVSEDGLLLDDTNVTAQMCIDRIRESETISEDKKELFCDIVQRIADHYPDSDFNILYQNLKSLKVEEADSMTMLMKTLDSSAYACYVMSENTIYLPENVQYIEGEWDYQVIIHEFCHACRTSWFDRDDIHYRLEFDSDWQNNEILTESMNSAFSCSLLNYYEPDIAYQMPSNYLRIMLECMDNYELTDYMNHSDLYFLSKLDEYAGYTNYAQVIWKLITLQRSDWNSDNIDIVATKYEPIYDFLCELYYGKYLTDDMTAEEAMALADELADKAGYGCPEGYKFEKEYFSEYMENLLANR